MTTGRTRIGAAPILAFVALAVGLAWLVALPLWLGDGLASPWTGLLLPAMMFTPAAAVLLVLLVFRPIPKGERLRFLGMWPLRPAKRVVWMSVLGLLAPPLVVFITLLVAAALGWIQLDLVGLSGAAEVFAQASPETPMPPTVLLVAAQLLSIPFAAATINAVLAFGEELGWRGFLVPALVDRWGTTAALLLSGAIWGLWHAPIILLGYNFGRTGIDGVLFMTGGCLVWGVLLGWLRLRSASVWPAVFAHGALNAAGGMFALLYLAGTTTDLAFSGPLGVASWIVGGALILVLLLTGQFRTQPALAHGAPAASAEPPA